MSYSASQAAKAAGVSIPTITRAIKKGTISAQRNPSGGYQIDPSELHRVFPAVKSKGDVTSAMLGNEIPHEIQLLELKVEMLGQQLADRDSTILDLRQRLDAEAEDRRKYFALLSHDKATDTQDDEAKPTKSRSWLRWLVGRSSS